MPLGDRWRGRRRRLIRDGDEYTADELARGEVELEVPEPRAEPAVEVQGEPWGWTKAGPRPEGWREDGQYGPRNRDDPGPYDGAWEPPERGDRDAD
jgi:hypothetical protein